MVQLHRHEFEESINGLRGLLLRRRSSLEALRNLVHVLQHKSGIQLKENLHLREKGHIERLQLEGEHLRTPMQLMQRVEELRQRFGSSEQAKELPRRITRSFGAENDNEAVETLKVKRLRVGNLLYKGVLMPGIVFIVIRTSTS